MENSLLYSAERSPSGSGQRTLDQARVIIGTARDDVFDLLQLRERSAHGGGRQRAMLADRVDISRLGITPSCQMHEDSPSAHWHFRDAVLSGAVDLNRKPQPNLPWGCVGALGRIA